MNNMPRNIKVQRQVTDPRIAFGLNTISAAGSATFSPRERNIATCEPYAICFPPPATVG